MTASQFVSRAIPHTGSHTARPAEGRLRLSSRGPAAGRWRFVLVLPLLLALAACDSAEERAERHYERAVALVEAGEPERAGLEFRNVFRLNGAHVRARLDYARLLRSEGQTREAIAQYLRLVEQDRRSAEGHRELAAIAFALQDFALLEEHAPRAHDLDPGHPLGRALQAALALRAGEREAARDGAEAALAEEPALIEAHMVAIAERMSARDHEAALALADRAIAAIPGDEGLHLARHAALDRMGDRDGAGAELVRMAELFPENDEIARALVGWHMERGDGEAAEAVLRARAARRPDDAAGHLLVARFLAETRGTGAARAELERLAAAAGEAGGDALPYIRTLAGLDFAEGRRAEAVAALEAALGDGDGDGGGVATDAGRDAAIALAHMLRETGRRAEAAARAEAVLAADPGHVEALKLRAGDHLAADRTGQAIADLRAALAQDPRDAEALTLLAAAHEREGARELAGERLALAVEVTGAAPEALRYGRFLLEANRAAAAEEVVLRALRRAPEDADLLAALAEIHLSRGDLARARQTARLLAGSDAPVAREAAAAIELAALREEGRTEEALALLEAHAEASPDARLGLVRSRAASGDLAGAGAALEALLQADPDSLPGRLVAADLLLLGGDAEGAEDAYRALAAERPDLAATHGALGAFLAAAGRAGEAEAALEAGIAATEGAAELVFARAGLAEAREDFDGAIALYEDLYARDSGNLVIANNLASLLATHRDDADSLERAHRIARRLQGSDVPHFQDTWGWILHRRGASAEALAYLEPAAAALGHDPLVQYHLGMAYLATGRRDAAREALGRAVALAGEGSTLPQIAAARARLGEMDGQDLDGQDAGGSGG